MIFLQEKCINQIKVQECSMFKTEHLYSLYENLQIPHYMTHSYH